MTLIQATGTPWNYYSLMRTSQFHNYSLRASVGTTDQVSLVSSEGTVTLHGGFHNSFEDVVESGYVTSFDWTINGANYVSVSGFRQDAVSMINKMKSTTPAYSTTIDNLVGQAGYTEIGTSGNDSLFIKECDGPKCISGGAGIDTAYYREFSDIPSINISDRWRVVGNQLVGYGGIITLDSVEYIGICDLWSNSPLGTSVSVDSLHFDASSYMARNLDVYRSFGGDAVSATQHWISYGRSEGRSTETFDLYAYIASYADLTAAFGDNTGAALQHWAVNGAAEGRGITFNSTGYLTRNPDVAAAGLNAAQHWLDYGRYEGRLAG